MELITHDPAPGSDLPDLNDIHADVLDVEWARLMRAPSLEALGDEMIPALIRVRAWATKHIQPYCAIRWSTIDRVEPYSVYLEDGSVIQAGETYARKLERFNVD